MNLFISDFGATWQFFIQPIVHTSAANNFALLDLQSVTLRTMKAKNSKIYTKLINNFYFNLLFSFVKK